MKVTLFLFVFVLLWWWTWASPSLIACRDGSCPDFQIIKKNTNTLVEDNSSITEANNEGNTVNKEDTIVTQNDAGEIEETEEDTEATGLQEKEEPQDAADGLSPNKVNLEIPLLRAQGNVDEEGIGDMEPEEEDLKTEEDENRSSNHVIKKELAKDVLGQTKTTGDIAKDELTNNQGDSSVQKRAATHHHYHHPATRKPGNPGNRNKTQTSQVNGTRKVVHKRNAAMYNGTDPRYIWVHDVDVVRRKRVTDEEQSKMFQIKEDVGGSDIIDSDGEDVKKGSEYMANEENTVNKTTRRNHRSVSNPKLNTQQGSKENLAITTPVPVPTHIMKIQPEQNKRKVHKRSVASTGRKLLQNVDDNEVHLTESNELETTNFLGEELPKKNKDKNHVRCFCTFDDPDSTPVLSDHYLEHTIDAIEMDLLCSRACSEASKQSKVILCSMVAYKELYQDHATTQEHQPHITICQVISDDQPIQYIRIWLNTVLLDIIVCLMGMGLVCIYLVCYVNRNRKREVIFRLV